MSEIHEIVNGNSAPLNHSEQKIAGYRDALAEIHTGYGDMDFRQSDILRLHSIMMNIAGYSYAGKYKEYDNDIIEEDKNGRRRVRFHPTLAADTPDEMWNGIYYNSICLLQRTGQEICSNWE